MERRLSKVLSANDVGQTGSHQAGIAVPRQPDALSFFPRLDASAHNPRRVVQVLDRSSRELMELNYIYYNGKLHGRSTRNEYRLTGLTRLFAMHDARPGDRLDFTWSELTGYAVELVREPEAESSESGDDDIIVLSGEWFTTRRSS